MFSALATVMNGMHETLPAGSGQPSNFVDIIINMANGLRHMGEVVRQKAEGARDLIGKLLIELGCNLHNLL